MTKYNSISSFADLANQQEVEFGLDKLKFDIENNNFQKIKEIFESSTGDYIFIKAKKIIDLSFN